MKERRKLTHAQEKLCWDNNPHICNICGKQIQRISDVWFDHSNAYTKGGKTNLKNVKLAHRACNQHKGTKTLTVARKSLGYHSNIKITNAEMKLTSKKTRKSTIKKTGKNQFDMTMDKFQERGNQYVGIRNHRGKTIKYCTILCGNQKCVWWDNDNSFHRHIPEGSALNVILPKESENTNPAITVMSGKETVEKIKLNEIVLRQ